MHTHAQRKDKHIHNSQKLKAILLKFLFRCKWVRNVGRFYGLKKVVIVRGERNPI